MPESIRLAKRVAELASCSRREADQYIEGGWVKVNGQVTEEPGFRVLPQHAVELMPDATLEPLEPVTILLHKPSGYGTSADMQFAEQRITSDTRAAADRSGIRFLKRHLANLTMTDALDASASGLIVFTQDWRVARKLIDDAAKIEHEYIVEVTGDLVLNGLALLNHGLSFNGKPLPPIKVSWQNETHLRFALKGGQPGQIEHMCKMVGLKRVGMKRMRIGRVPMAGLQVGEWRYLLGYERF